MPSFRSVAKLVAQAAVFVKTRDAVITTIDNRTDADPESFKVQVAGNAAGAVAMERLTVHTDRFVDGIFDSINKKLKTHF